MTFYLTDIAGEIHGRELGSPNDLTKGFIEYWLREHVGELNNNINTTFIVHAQDGQIQPSISDEAKAVFKKMFMVHFWEKKVRETLGAASVDSVVEVSENGARIRLTSKNSIAQSYMQIKKEVLEELRVAINAYKESNFTILDLPGKDTIKGNYQDEIADTNPRAVTN